MTRRDLLEVIVDLEYLTGHDPDPHKRTKYGQQLQVLRRELWEMDNRAQFKVRISRIFGRSTINH